MLPHYEQLDGWKPLIKIPVRKFIVPTVLLPAISFAFCVVWSMLFYYKETTSTHCRVPNLLPSASAAVGHYQPQRLAFQTAVCLGFVPRFILMGMYRRLYNENIVLSRRYCADFVCLFAAIENCALLGATFYTSSGNMKLHKIFFFTFAVSSVLHMVFSYVLNKTSRKLRTLSNFARTSFAWKKIMCFTHITAFLVAMYLFRRHNRYCEPGVYTIFAVFEYIVGTTNVGFHMTAYWDFYDKVLILDWCNGIYLR